MSSSELQGNSVVLLGQPETKFEENLLWPFQRVPQREEATFDMCPGIGVNRKIQLDPPGLPDRIQGLEP